MRTVAIIAAIIALGLVAALFAGLIKFDADAEICRHDDEIEADLRDGAVAAAQAFFDGVVSHESDAAYDALTPAAKEKMSRPAFDRSVKTIRGNGPYADLRVDHAFHPPPGAAGTVECGGDVAVSALPDATQIHVVLSAHTRNHDWALTAWLVKEKEAWQVHGFHVAMASLVGHDAAALLALANEQKEKGHAFAAHMLYGAAKATADRGPDLELAVRREIEAARAVHETPSELSGEPPFKWTFDDTAFEVETVSIVGVGRRLGLVFLHRDPSWDGRETGRAEKHNKRLIDGFVKAHPEYAETFGFLVARSLEPGKNSGWGTVFDAVKGYDTGEPSVVPVKKKK